MRVKEKRRDEKQVFVFGCIVVKGQIGNERLKFICGDVFVASSIMVCAFAMAGTV